MRKTRCCCIENRNRLILNKIIGYCDRVRDNLNRYQSSYEAFQQDYLFQDACCMCVVQIGELVAQLSEEAKQQNRAVPWRMIKDTRNFYVHSYGAIDLPAVWKTLCEDLPELKSACVQMIESANS